MAMLSSRSVTANTTIQAASRPDLISGAEMSMSARVHDAPQTRPASSISEDNCFTLLRRNMNANRKRCAVNAMKNSQMVPNNASGSALKPSTKPTASATPGNAKVTVEAKVKRPRPGSAVRSTIQTTIIPNTTQALATTAEISALLRKATGTMVEALANEA